mgnify:CR=1 FL=1
MIHESRDITLSRRDYERVQFERLDFYELTITTGNDTVGQQKQELLVRESMTLCNDRVRLFEVAIVSTGEDDSRPIQMNVPLGWAVSRRKARALTGFVLGSIYKY